MPENLPNTPPPVDKGLVKLLILLASPLAGFGLGLLANEPLILFFNIHASETAKVGGMVITSLLASGYALSDLISVGSNLSQNDEETSQTSD